MEPLPAGAAARPQSLAGAGGARTKRGPAMDFLGFFMVTWKKGEVKPLETLNMVFFLFNWEGGCVFFWRV